MWCGELENGIALEWCEFAPRAVRALLASVRMQARFIQQRGALLQAGSESISWASDSPPKMPRTPVVHYDALDKGNDEPVPPSHSNAQVLERRLAVRRMSRDASNLSGV